MTISTLRLGILGLAGVALAGLAVSTGSANSNAGSDLQCGVTTATQGGMLAIEGVLLSPSDMTGEYRLQVRSSSNGGSSNVSQGGAFAAAANATTLLGKVMLNANANFDIDFTVTANGQTLDCGTALTSNA
jgi:hypothetical protein